MSRRERGRRETEGGEGKKRNREAGKEREHR